MVMSCLAVVRQRRKRPLDRGRLDTREPAAKHHRAHTNSCQPARVPHAFEQLIITAGPGDVLHLYLTVTDVARVVATSHRLYTASRWRQCLPSPGFESRYSSVKCTNRDRGPFAHIATDHIISQVVSSHVRHGSGASCASGVPSGTFVSGGPKGLCLSALCLARLCRASLSLFPVPASAFTAELPTTPSSPPALSAPSGYLRVTRPQQVYLYPHESAHFCLDKNPVTDATRPLLSIQRPLGPCPSWHLAQPLSIDGAHYRLSVFHPVDQLYRPTELNQAARAASQRLRGIFASTPCPPHLFGRRILVHAFRLSNATFEWDPVQLRYACGERPPRGSRDAWYRPSERHTPGDIWSVVIDADDCRLVPLWPSPVSGDQPQQWNSLCAHVPPRAVCWIIEQCLEREHWHEGRKRWERVCTEHAYVRVFVATSAPACTPAQREAALTVMKELKDRYTLLNELPEYAPCTFGVADLTHGVPSSVWVEDCAHPCLTVEQPFGGRNLFKAYRAWLPYQEKGPECGLLQVLRQTTMRNSCEDFGGYRLVVRASSATELSLEVVGTAGLEYTQRMWSICTSPHDFDILCAEELAHGAGVAEANELRAEGGHWAVTECALRTARSLTINGQAVVSAARGFSGLHAFLQPH